MHWTLHPIFLAAVLGGAILLLVLWLERRHTHSAKAPQQQKAQAATLADIRAQRLRRLEVPNSSSSTAAPPLESTLPELPAGTADDEAPAPQGQQQQQHQGEKGKRWQQMTARRESQARELPRSRPLESLDALLSWVPDYDAYNVSRVPLRKRLFKPQTRLLVCHDYKGGYVEDACPQGERTDKVYSLQHWQLIDSFVYFSHRFVTIPPSSWTNCAHRNGVKVLGTIITEWDDGKALCKALLGSPETRKRAASQLAAIMQYYHFDGWLVNIENRIELEHVRFLREFVALITQECHALLPHATVLWYDSVTAKGHLKWQDTLNEENKLFFDVCDGIFLNYAWKEDKLATAKRNAGSRSRDVYVGIDSFGRGSFGGGQLQTFRAVEAVIPTQQSIALFAPAWTYEDREWAEYLEYQAAFWRQFETRLVPQRLCGLPLNTTFCQGFGAQLWAQGHPLHAEPWANLSHQSVLPSFPLSDTNPYFTQPGAAAHFSHLHAELDDSIAFQGGSSFKVSCASRHTSVHTGMRALFRLFPVALSLEAPLCVSVVVGQRKNTPSSLLGTLIFVLNDVADGARYLELPLVDDSAHFHQLYASRDLALLPAEPKLDQRLKEKYSLQRSPMWECIQAADRLVVGAVEPLTGEAQIEINKHSTCLDKKAQDAGGPVEWHRYWFVLMHPWLRSRQLHEVRLAVQHAESSGLETDSGLWLGQLQLLHPSSLYQAVTRSLDLQAYNLTVNAENLHVTLDLLWTQHDFVDYCDVFVRRDTGLRFLGRCFSNCFRVCDLVLGPADVSEDGLSLTLEFSVAPVTHAGIRVRLEAADTLRIEARLKDGSLWH